MDNAVWEVHEKDQWRLRKPSWYRLWWKYHPVSCFVIQSLPESIVTGKPSLLNALTTRWYSWHQQRTDAWGLEGAFTRRMTIRVTRQELAARKTFWSKTLQSFLLPCSTNLRLEQNCLQYLALPQRHCFCDTSGLFVCIYFLHMHSDLLREYCNWETFNATCPRGEVILVTSARYGWMKMGRCLHVAASHIVGCQEDIIRYVDLRAIVFVFSSEISFLSGAICVYITRSDKSDKLRHSFKLTEYFSSLNTSNIK